MPFPHSSLSNCGLSKPVVQPTNQPTEQVILKLLFKYAHIPFCRPTPNKNTEPRCIWVEKAMPFVPIGSRKAHTLLLDHDKDGDENVMEDGVKLSGCSAVWQKYFHRLYGLKESNGNCEGCGCDGFPTHGSHGSVTSFHSQTGYVWWWDHVNFDLPKFLGWKHVKRCYPWYLSVRGRLVRCSPTKRCDSFTRIVSVLKCSPRMRWEWTSSWQNSGCFPVEVEMDPKLWPRF